MVKLVGTISICLSFLVATTAQASTKADSLKAMGWNSKQASPALPKTFASDVEARRKTDLDQVLADMITLFGGGHPCTFYVTGASQSAYQPLLDSAAAIFGHTPQLGSYLSSVGIDSTDPRSPVFVIFVEKESMADHEHQLAVFAHEYYHVYQNAQLLEQPESAEPHTWIMEGGAKLFETLYVNYRSNDYTYKQENVTELLTETKNYYDANSFSFGTAQETHAGINPPRTSNYNVGSVAMIYLAHLSSYHKVLSPDLYAAFHEKGFLTAFNETFGMSPTTFYSSMNAFFQNSTLAEVQAIAPKTNDLTTLLAPPDTTDADGDGLSKYDETVRYGTSLTLSDTDADGLTDKQEVDLSLDPLSILSNFDQAQDSGQGWKNLTGFGYYFPTGNSWYHHNGMGWFYTSSLDLSDFWIHLPDFGWCWTRQSLFPYFYEHKTSSWLCFSSTDSNRFYRYSDNAWSLVE
jgi:hypothetical protein